MLSRRTLLALAVAAATSATAVLLVQVQGRAGAAGTQAPRAAAATVGAASTVTAAAPEPTASGGATSTLPGSEALEAARTVDRFCKLVTRDRRRAAGDLLTAARVWPLRQLRAIRTLRLRSVRVMDAPDARTLVLRARVHVHGGRRCRLRDGRNTLLFTLGRVGTTTGGWLISAVRARP